jgi:hypothetical protein
VVTFGRAPDSCPPLNEVMLMYASSAVRELPIPPVTAFDAAELILVPENAFWREKTAPAGGQGN